MRKNSSNLRGPSVAIAVLLTLAGHLLHHLWLAYLFTPLATLLILFFAFSSWRSRKDFYSLWITIGLFFSLFGDIALLWPASYFLPGLTAFAVTHFAYLIAFTRYAKFPARPPIWLLYLAMAVASLAFLFPTLPNGLKAPVILYALLLASMAGQAMGRFFLLKTRPAQLAAIGGTFFLLSDLLLAFDRFRTPLPLASIWILLSYYLAQWLIAQSTTSS